MIKLATWNVNSLSVRLPQVVDWLAANPVDALCLQELKLTDEKFRMPLWNRAGGVARGSDRASQSEARSSRAARW